MDRYVVILFWVLVCAVILLSTPTKCVLNGKDGKDVKEGFYTYFSYFKQYCPSCNERTSFACDKCTNCTTCILPNGQSFCTPGDASGPFFRTDCAYTKYGSTDHYYPYSHLYPNIREKSIYPYTHHRTVQKPWKWNKAK